MPSTKYAGLDGRQVTQAALKEIRDAAAEMRSVTVRDELPTEYKTRIQRERTGAVKAARQESLDAMLAWSEEAVKAATKIINTRTLGTQAEETRRASDETRISRLVSTALTRGDQRATATDLAVQAEAAFNRGDADESWVLAQASMALGGPALPRNPSDPSPMHPRTYIETIQTSRDLADPAKAAAFKALQDVNVVSAAFDRDVTGALAGALQDAIALAHTVGDHAGATLLMPEVAVASMRAKQAAFDGSRRFGDGVYKSPEGVLHEGPLNGDPRGPSQPDGAHLSSRNSTLEGES
jgi:hypothetical protein